METLVVVAHHRNHQYHGRSRDYGLSSTRFGSCSPPTGGFRGINCRTFHSGEGLLSPPPKSCSSKTKSLVTKKAFCPSLSPNTPSPSVCENPKMLKGIAIPILMDTKFESRDEGFQFSELWAGPAYSNSPPPSCLPVPKFTLKPKRTISLDLPTVASEIDLPLSHSAPASPRECSPSPSDLFDIADSATKTLRRMLNLDIDDE
ncbi:hypothetical protein SASPL_135203 [Salvia splendens]|uniref:Uncharacterized protein n=1 Tax=Salvia splendens TaxID=180675 RepID=A0A8X8ZFR1_SALSN|nr:hypothetical protein SASPL_135203 [Salvia splendens]